MSKKFIKEYQPVDLTTGKPVGPIQHFEGDTMEELLEAIVKSNMNASAALYAEKQENRAKKMLENADLEQPLPSYEERVLTAEERLALSRRIADPATAPEALKDLVEAAIGAPVSRVRQILGKMDLEERVAAMKAAVRAWRLANPQYFGSLHNQERMQNYLTKHNLAVTENNLDIAYKSLSEANLLESDPSASTVTTEETPAVATESVETPIVEEETPVTPAPRWTQESAIIEARRLSNMGFDDFKLKLQSDPEFKAALEGKLPEPSAPVEKVTVIPATESAVPVVTPTVPPTESAITTPATPAEAIPQTPAAVRPRPSSSGLSTRGSSAVPPSTATAAPKTGEMTAEQFRRKVRTMTADQYTAFVADPANKALVDKYGQ